LQEKQMISTRNGTQLIVLMAGALVLAACGKQEAPPPPPPKPAPAPAAPAQAPAPPAAAATPAPASGTKVESVALGTAVDASGNLASAPATEFTPTQTIYAVVSTNNSGTNPSTVSAHWEFQGGVTVNDSTQPVTAAGPSVTTFHIEKASGWPPGHYRLVVSVDGQQAATKEFEVK
jgi:hypothetical protein